MMKFIFSNLFSIKTEPPKTEPPNIEINYTNCERNYECLNNSASHFCYAGGSNCCHNLNKNHYCNKDKIGCIH